MIVCEAKDEESQAPLIVYRSLEFPEQIWVRTKEAFCGCVVKKNEAGVSCGVIPRFEPAMLLGEDLKHGDDKHQAWLKEAITDHFKDVLRGLA